MTRVENKVRSVVSRLARLRLMDTLPKGLGSYKHPDITTDVRAFAHNIHLEMDLFND